MKYPEPLGHSTQGDVELLEGRDVGQETRAAGASHAQHPDLAAGLHVREEPHLLARPPAGCAPQQVHNRRLGTAEACLHHFHAQKPPEQLAQEMRPRAGGTMAKRGRIRVTLDPGQVVVEATNRFRDSGARIANPTSLVETIPTGTKSLTGSHPRSGTRV